MSLVSDIVDAVGGIVDAGASIFSTAYNIGESKRSRKEQNDLNAFDQSMSLHNAQLQEEAFRNGLGVRISDAERNGISKWSVVGDGANVGTVAGSNGTAYSGGHIDAKLNALSTLQTVLQTRNIAEQNKAMQTDNSIKEYNLNWAKEHQTPYGQQADLAQSLVNWLNTSNNRGTVTDVLSDAKKVVDNLGNTKINLPNPFNYFERKSKERKIKSEERKIKKEDAKKAKKNRINWEKQKAGGLPLGSIPQDVILRGYK